MPLSDAVDTLEPQATPSSGGLASAVDEAPQPAPPQVPKIIPSVPQVPQSGLAAAADSSLEARLSNDQVSLFKQRAQLRDSLFQGIQSVKDMQGASITPSDHMRVEGQIQKMYPVSDDQRNLEVAWGHSLQGYDPQTGYGSNVFTKSLETASMGLDRGVAALGESAVFMSTLPYRAQAAGAKLGAKALGVQYDDKMEDAINSFQGFLGKLKDNYYPDQVQMSIDPNTVFASKGAQGFQASPGQATIGLGYKYLGELAEGVPSMIAALYTGGMAEEASIATAATRGLTKEAAEAAAGNAAQKVTAATFAGVGMLGRHDQMQQMAVQKGYDPGTADAIGNFGALAGVVPDYFLNLVNPIALVNKGVNPVKSIPGEMIAAAAQNSVQGFGSQAVTQTIAALTTAQGNIYNQSFDQDKAQFLLGAYSSLEAGANAAVIGGLTGLGIKAVELGLHQPSASLKDSMTNAIIDSTGQDPDVMTSQGFTNKVKRDFNTKPAEANSSGALTDAMSSVWAANTGTPDEMAFGAWHAHLNEMQEAEAKNQGYQLYDTVNSSDNDSTGGLYDNVRSTVIDKFSNKGKLPAAQILSTLQNSGLKSDAMKFSGIQQMLSDASDAGVSLSRQELVNFLDQKQIKIGTLIKGEDNMPADVKAQSEQLFKQMEQAELERDNVLKGLDSIDVNDPKQRPKAEEIRDKFRELDIAYNQAKETYKSHMEQTQLYGDREYTRYSQVSPDGPSSNYKEMVVTWIQPKEFPEGAVDEDGFPYQNKEQVKFSSSHWDEPNVLMHIRMDDRVDPETGKTFLNVIEAQSDWHQEGREIGYNDPNFDLDAKHKETADLVNELNLLQDKASKLVDDWKQADYDDDHPAKLELDETNKRVIETQDKIKELDNALNDHDKKVSEAPFAKNWHELAMKKVLLHAVERGYDRVAIQPGFMQDRFQGSVIPERGKFYDEILPRALLKLAQKFDPSVRLETAKMQTGVSTPYTREEMEQQGGTFAEGANVADVQRAINGVGGNTSSKSNIESVDLTSLPITQKLIDGITEKGIPLYQTIGGVRRASTTLLSTGRGFISGLTKPNFDSAIHEVGHLARLFFLNGADKASVEKTLGVKNGKWSRQNEEDFVSAFQGFLREGYSPDPQLQKPFNVAARMLKKAYPTLTPEQKVGMSSEMKEVFERLFQQDTQPIASARGVLAQMQSEEDNRQTAFNKLNGKLSRAKQIEAADPTKPVDPQLMADTAKAKSLLAGARQQRVGQEEQITRLQQSAFRDGADTVAAKRAAQLDEFEAAYKGDPEKYRLYGNRLVDGTANLVKSTSHNLESTRDGRVAIQAFDNIARDAKNYRGQMSALVRETVGVLDPATKSWMRQKNLVNERVASSNHQQLMEDNPNNPVKVHIQIPDRAALYKEGAVNIQNHSFNEMMSLETNRRFRNGVASPLEPSTRRSYQNRNITEEAMNQIFTNYKNLKKWSDDHSSDKGGIQKNPKAEEVMRQVKESVLGISTDKNGNETAVTVNRTRGSLEGIRSLDFVGDYWRPDSKSRWIKVLESDPVSYIERVVHGDGMRLAVTRNLGQSMVKNMYMDADSMVSFLKHTGDDVDYSKADLIATLQKNNFGTQAGLAKRKPAELKKLAISMGLPTRMEPAEMWAAIQGKTVDDIPRDKLKESVAGLRQLARDVGGIDPRAPMQKVLADLKTRLSANIEDMGIYRLAQNHENAGGNPMDVFQAFRNLQGYPIGSLKGKLAGAADAAKLGMSVLNASVTSCAPMMDMFRVPAMVAPIFGPGATLEGAFKFLSDPSGAFKRAVQTGAVQESLHNWWRDDGSLIRNVDNSVRELGSLAFGQKLVRWVNVGLTQSIAEAYGAKLKARAESGDLTGKDKFVMDFARIDKLDQQRIQSGDFQQKDMQTLVQNALARTEGGSNEAGHNRAYLELNDFAKTFLEPFQNFTYTLARYESFLFQQLKKGPSDPAFKHAAMAALVHIGASIGTVALSDMMKNALFNRAKKPDSDESVLAYLGHALFKTTIGRALDFAAGPFEHNSTGNDVVANMTFPLHVLSNGVQLLIDGLNKVEGKPATGRYGRLPFAQDVAKTYEGFNPALAGVIHGINVREHPSIGDYEEARNFSASWLKKNKPDASETQPAPINPDTDAIVDALKQHDAETARNVISSVVRRNLTETNPPIQPGKTLDSIYESLLHHAPVPIENNIEQNDYSRSKFWQTLSADQKQRFAQSDGWFRGAAASLTNHPIKPQ